MRIIIPIILIITGFVYSQAKADIICNKNNTEQQCLACNIYYEARNQNFVGQIAVATVTKNRVLSEKYPNTYCKVVWQSKQFSWTHDGRSDKPYENNAWQSSINLAKLFIESEISIEKLTENTLWYHRDDVQPKWSKKLNIVAILERHIFYEYTN